MEGDCDCGGGCCSMVGDWSLSWDLSSSCVIREVRRRVCRPVPPHRDCGCGCCVRASWCVLLWNGIISNVNVVQMYMY